MATCAVCTDVTEADGVGYVPEIFCQPKTPPGSGGSGVQGEEDDTLRQKSLEHEGKLPSDDFVEVAALQLQHLPEPIRCDKVLQAIRQVAGRVVRVTVTRLCPARRGQFRMATTGPGHQGTGLAVFVHHLFVIVSTNRHVIYDDEEARNSKIEFFADSNATIDRWRVFSGSGIINADTGHDFTLVVYWLQSPSHRQLPSRRRNPDDVRKHKDLTPFQFPHLAHTHSSTDIHDGARSSISTEPGSSFDQKEPEIEESTNFPATGVDLVNATANTVSTNIAVIVASSTTSDACPCVEDASAASAAGGTSALLGNKKYVCVIAHPNDRTKHVSFGEILSENALTREFHHNAPTRQGSSGAPIMIFSAEESEAPPDSIWYHCGLLKGPSEVRVARLQVNNPRLFTTEFNRDLVGWKMLDDLLQHKGDEGGIASAESVKGQESPGLENSASADEVEKPSKPTQQPPPSVQSSSSPSVTVATQLLLWVFLSGRAVLHKAFPENFSKQRGSEQQTDHSRLVESFQNFGTLVCKLLEDDEIDTHLHPISFFTLAKALADLHEATHSHSPCFCTALKSSGFDGAQGEPQPPCKSQAGGLQRELSPSVLTDVPLSTPGPDFEQPSTQPSTSSDSLGVDQQLPDPGLKRPSPVPWMSSDSLLADKQWPEGCVLQRTFDLLTTYFSSAEITILNSHPVMYLLLRIATQIARVMILGGVLAKERNEQAKPGAEEMGSQGEMPGVENLDTSEKPSEVHKVSATDDTVGDEASKSGEQVDSEKCSTSENAENKESADDPNAQSPNDQDKCFTGDRPSSKTLEEENGSPQNPSVDVSVLVEILAVFLDSINSLISIADPWRQVASELQEPDACASCNNNGDQGRDSADGTASTNEKSANNKGTNSDEIEQKGNDRISAEDERVNQNPRPQTSGGREPDPHPQKFIPEGEESSPGQHKKMDELFTHLLQHESVAPSLTDAKAFCRCGRPSSRLVQQEVKALHEELLSQRSRSFSQASLQNPAYAREVEDTKARAAMAAIVSTFSCMSGTEYITDSRQEISLRLQDAVDGCGAPTIRTIWKNLELILFCARNALALARKIWQALKEKGDSGSPRIPDTMPRDEDSKVAETESSLSGTGTLAVQATGTQLSPRPSGAGGDQAVEQQQKHGNEESECRKKPLGPLPRSVPEYQVFCYLCWSGKKQLIEDKRKQTTEFWNLQNDIWEKAGKERPKGKPLLDWKTTLRGWMATVAVDALSCEDERYKESPKVFQLINRYGRRIFLAGCRHLIASPEPLRVPALNDEMQPKDSTGEASQGEDETSATAHTEDESADESLQMTTRRYTEVLEILKQPEYLEKLERLMMTFAVDTVEPNQTGCQE